MSRVASVVLPGVLHLDVTVLTAHEAWVLAGRVIIRIDLATRRTITTKLPEDNVGAAALAVDG